MKLAALPLTLVWGIIYFTIERFFIYFLYLVTQLFNLLVF